MITTQTRRPRRSWGKLRRRTSGRWEASYEHNLSRHSAPITFTAKMDGEAWLASERRLIEQGEWTPPKLRAAATTNRGKRFGEYATGWLDQRNLKPRTRQGYSELIDGPLAKLGKIPLGQITPETVRVWFTGLGTATPTKNSHAYQLLRAVLNTAVTDGLITSNPAVIRGAGTTETKRQAVILTPDEVHKVALAMPDNLTSLVLVSAWAGLRWGEVTALTRADVSADASEITIACAVTHRAGQCYVETPKSGRVRSVIVPPHIRQDLLDHLTNFVDAAPDSLLFKAAKACHYNERTFRDAFAVALKAVGITANVRIHDLRHFAGTQAARVGNLVETMQRLGHSTPKASLIYQAVASGRDRELAAALSELATG